MVLADGTRQTEVTVDSIVFAQVASRAKTAAFFRCFVSFDALGATALVGVTLCKSNGAFGADVKVFKFAGCAIGTFGAAVFGGTAKSTLVAGNLSIFVSGKRIFRAKLAFNGTNVIVEFTLKIDQETKTIIYAIKIKEEQIQIKEEQIHEVVNIVLVRKVQYKENNVHNK